MMWILYIAIVVATFFFMEFVAWAAHKYVMHGIGWFLHEDHHQGGYHPFQKNDAFFLIFAIPSWLFIMLGWMNYVWPVVCVGVGIFLYGWCYFLVHDVIVHQRFKWFEKSDNTYVKVIRWAHKMHHKHMSKEAGESFGLLIVPKKYWDKVRKDEAQLTKGMS
jgi:beta-carotene 3-hydroxylase